MLSGQPDSLTARRHAAELLNRSRSQRATAVPQVRPAAGEDGRATGTVPIVVLM